MVKTERLIAIMITINAKKHFTAGELAKEFSVSKRTILRDLQELAQIGFPLYSEVGAAGGYQILNERILPPISFSENEAKAIFFACQALKFYRDLPFEQETLSVLKKFLNCLPLDIQSSIIKIQDKIVFWSPDRHCDSPLLKSLFQISIDNQSATIRYSSAHSESIRTIIPIGLYAMNGLWYCPSYCTATKQIREFRVDRIQEIIEIFPSQKHQPLLPSSIQDYLETLEYGVDCHLKIQLTAEGVKQCETDFLLARGLKKLPTGEGMIDMTIRRSSLEWITDYCLSLGSNAHILEPIELIDIMKTKVLELYKQYSGTP